MILAEGARSVLILDLDAHCGGGTHWLIDGDDRIRQIDVSVNGVDGYAPSGANTLNIVRVAGDYLEVIESRLNELDIKPDLCIYNAGMDADERCEVGGLPGIDAAMLKKREAIVFDWAKSRGVSIAFVLAGGYSGTTL
jgi:acetoin utilization deacetylase AcuC-like enzyme